MCTTYFTTKPKELSGLLLMMKIARGVQTLPQ